jgi:predicted RNA-binding Zn-ribbon protein involved in translation (DUF1610 family)
MTDNSPNRRLPQPRRRPAMDRCPECGFHGGWHDDDCRPLAGEYAPVDPSDDPRASQHEDVTR